MIEKFIKMQYPNSASNKNYDGKEHTIMPLKLQKFNENGNEYYLLNYIDVSLKKNMFTLLTKDSKGNFMKRPLDNYDAFNNELSNYNLINCNLNELSNSIGLGANMSVSSISNSNRISLQFPYSASNSLYDGREHNIVPDSLQRFIKDGNEYYWLEAYDETHETNIGTLLTRDSHGNFIKRPLDNYDNIEEILNSVELEEVNINLLNNNITLGSEIQSSNLIKPSLDRVAYDYQAQYIVYRMNNGLFVDASVFNQIREYLNKPAVESGTKVPITQAEIDYIARVSHQPNYVATYVNRITQTAVKDPAKEPRRDVRALYRVYRTNDGLFVDSATYNRICGYLNKPRRVGGRIEITQEEIDYIARVSSEPNYVATYVNENTLGEGIIPPNPPGGPGYPPNLFGGGNGGPGGPPPNLSGGFDIPPDDPSINVKEEKFNGKQALFTVFRGLDGTLRVDAVEYEFYLNDLLEKETHPVVKGKVILTENDLEYIYNNSKNPELMPDFEIEYSEYNTRTMDIDNFNVYITNDGLELDTYDYTKFVELGLLEEREVTNKRVKITKEEIRNIENYNGEWHYYAKLVNQIQLKPEVAFTVYNVNTKHYEVTNNIYDRYLKKYLESNNNKERHGGWNENGDHFTVITDEDLKTIERESNNPKLTPTILYKERKKRDIYGNYVDDNTNDIDKVENNQQIIDNPPIKKRNKVKSMVKNTMDWAKEHPLLATIAIGLAVTLASQVALSGVMMLNSTLWSVLGGTGSACAKLHSINMALSKIVGFGAFKFIEAGTYTLAGKAGALALYSGVGAKLTTAVLGLTGIGGLGKLIANKIRKNKEKENEKEIEPTENNNKKSNDNNKQETTLTREQIAELVKQEVEKATEGLVKENKALKAENDSLRQQIEELVRTRVKCN